MPPPPSRAEVGRPVGNFGDRATIKRVSLINDLTRLQGILVLSLMSQIVQFTSWLVDRRTLSVFEKMLSMINSIGHDKTLFNLITFDCTFNSQKEGE